MTLICQKEIIEESVSPLFPAIPSGDSSLLWGCMWDMQTPLENIVDSSDNSRLFFEVRLDPSVPLLIGNYEIREDSINSGYFSITLLAAASVTTTSAAAATEDPSQKAKRLLAHSSSHNNPDCGLLSIDILLHRKESKLVSSQTRPAQRA